MGSAAITQTTTYDARMDASGTSAETVAGPGAAMGGTGSVAAGAYSSINQQITQQGFEAGDVRELFGDLLEDRNSERQSLTTLGQSMASGVQAQSAQLGNMLAAAKTPDYSTLKTLLPVLVIVALLIALKR